MDYIKLMKDPTRGGIGTALNEIGEYFNGSIEIIEDQIPISKEVWAINEILGIDPLYLPSEGRMILVVKKEMAKEILNKIRRIEGCEKAKIIGIFRKDVNNIVYLRTTIGGKRIIGMLENPMLPRIC